MGTATLERVVQHVLKLTVFISLGPNDHTPG